MLRSYDEDLGGFHNPGDKMFFCPNTSSELISTQNIRVDFAADLFFDSG